MSLYDKAKELQEGGPSPSPKDERGKRTQRTSPWENSEEFIDKASGLGVQIRKRIKGRPEYSLTLGHFSERGFSPFIPFPLKKLTRPLHEMTYLLMKRAEEWVAEHPLPKPRKDKRQDKGKGKGKGKRDDKRREEQGGLSALAQKDAAAGGHEHTGKTASKRQKKAG